MNGETILCIATRAWHSPWRNTQQIMSRIAARNRVLFFESGRNPDLGTVGDLWRNMPNLFTVRSQKLSENLIVIPSPPRLPHMRERLPESVLQKTTPWIAGINARIMMQHVQQAIVQLKVRDPLLWIYDPFDVDLIGKFEEKLVCYYNYDEFPITVENTRIKEIVQQYDNLLTSRSNIIFATGRAQWERRKQVNPNTYFIPNGADFDLFHKALEPETVIPSDVENLKRPIIGYAGALGNQIDVDLLLQVAETFATSSVVLVGPERIPSSAILRSLRAMPNVHFVGQRELDNLPGYLKAFDVALIPYLLQGYTLTAYPLKLHEYLAAGRAIVATAMPELRCFSRVVHLAESHDEFIGRIHDALNDQMPQAIEARVAVARENTWDQRVAEIYRILDARLSSPEKRSL
jgi:glycosyltransferase involved in cell wall biosynthesis